MIRYELRKLFGSRVFLGLLLALLIANAALSWLNASENRVESTFSDTVQELILQYREDPVSFDVKYQEYLTARDAAYELWMQYFTEHREEPPTSLFEESFSLAPESGYGDGMLYQEVYLHVGRRAAYRSRLDEILRDAESNLTVVEDAYTRAYLEQMKERYTSLYTTPLSDNYAAGWDAYFSYQTGNLLLLPLLLLAAILLVHADAESGVEEVLFASKKGRNAVWMQKTLAMLVLCAGACTAFDAVSLAAFAGTTGLSGLGEFLAAFDGFRLCPYPVYAYEYLFLRVFIRIAFCFLLGMLFLLFARLLRNVLLTLGAGVAFCGLEVLLYRLPTYRLGDVWQALNLFRLLDANDVFSRYRSVGIFGTSVPMILFLPVLFCLGVTFCLCALWLVWRRQGRLRVKVRLPKFKLRLSVPHALACYEGEKLFLRAGLLLPVLVLLVCKLLSAANDANSALPFQESVYRSYMQSYQSVELAEAERLVAEEQANFDELRAQDALYRQKWEEGSCSYGEYLAATGAWESAQRKLDAFRRAADEVAHVREMREQGIDAQVVYATGWRVLCFKKPDLLLLLMLLLPAFAYAAEDRCGFRQILYASANGRARTAFTKLALCVGFAMIAGALCFLADALSVRALYTLPLPGASAVVVSALADIGADGSLLVTVLLLGLYKLLLCGLIALLGFALSALMKHPLVPALLLAVLLFPPYLVGIFVGGNVPAFCPANLFDLSIVSDSASLPLRIAFPVLTLFILFVSMCKITGVRLNIRKE